MTVSPAAVVRLQRRLRRDKLRRGILSKKPSTAFRQIAEDVRYLQQKGVRFNMDTYLYVDVHADRLKNNCCEVCLAGAVLVASGCVYTQDTQLGLDTTPTGAVTIKYALNSLRLGDPRELLRSHCGLPNHVCNELLNRFHEAGLLSVSYVGTMSVAEMTSLIDYLMALSRKCRKFGY